MKANILLLIFLISLPLSNNNVLAEHAEDRRILVGYGYSNDDPNIDFYEAFPVLLSVNWKYGTGKSDHPINDAFSLIANQGTIFYWVGTYEGEKTLNSVLSLDLYIKYEIVDRLIVNASIPTLSINTTSTNPWTNDVSQKTTYSFLLIPYNSIAPIMIGTEFRITEKIWLGYKVVRTFIKHDDFEKDKNFLTCHFLILGYVL
ncbi:hypothetical protein KJ966_15275 [bacterium]|nr:hypothetical protein [bacterium]